MAIEHGLSGFENGTIEELSSGTGRGTASCNVIADTTARSGAYHLHIAPLISTQRWVALPAGAVVGTSGTVTAGNHKRARLRFYLRINAFPSGSNPNEERIGGLGSLNGSAVMWMRASDGHVGVSIGAAAVVWSTAALVVGTWYRVIVDADFNVSANTLLTVSLQVTTDTSTPAVDETLSTSLNIGAIDSMSQIMFGDSGGDHNSAYSIDIDDLVWGGTSDTDAVSAITLPTPTKIIPATVIGVGAVAQWETGTYADVAEIPVDLVTPPGRGTTMSSVLGTGTEVDFRHQTAATLGIGGVVGLKVFVNMQVVSATGNVSVTVNGVTVTKSLATTYPTGAPLIGYMDWANPLLLTQTVFDALTFNIVKQNGTQQTFIGAVSAEVLYPPQTLTSLSPVSGSTLGGTPVTLTGAGFSGSPSVTFGGVAATTVVVVNSTTITCVAPANAAGLVTVVTGSATLANAYTYVAPTLTSVAPTGGGIAGATAVTLTGTGFFGVMAVTFGGTAATAVVVVNGTTIICVTPAHAAGVVTVAAGPATLAAGFTFFGLPKVASLAPVTGTYLGGTPVTITGTGFLGVPTVTFGGAAAAAIVVVNSTSITCVTPAGVGGFVDVIVTTGSGAVTFAAGFAYLCDTGSVNATALVYGALRLCQAGLGRAGRLASPEQLTDGLARLNDMLDAWGIERLTLFYLLRTVVTLTFGTVTYTVGPGGAINIKRPSYIDAAGLIIDRNAVPPFETPIDVFSDQQWEGTRQKTIPNPLARGVYYDHGWSSGLGLLSIYPVPNVSTTQLVLYTPQALTAFADLTTCYTFPPGYGEAIRYQLALRLSDEFGGLKDPALVASLAAKGLARIKRANVRAVEAVLDPRTPGLRLGGLETKRG